MRIMHGYIAAGSDGIPGANMRARDKMSIPALSLWRLMLGLSLWGALITGCSVASTQQLSLQSRGVSGDAHAPPSSHADAILVPPAPPAATTSALPHQSGDLGAMAAGPDDAQRRQAPPPTVFIFDFPVVFNDQVKAMLRHYQRHKALAITQGFARARRYTGMMRAIFLEKGLPQELVNLAFVESDVNPRATSHASAAGIWQFMPSTARLYGMRTNSWLDERRDPEKSTRAAAGYLKHLYEQFQSWPLALAAYNAGEAPVRRAIARQRTNDFWRLRLPKETRRFVPSFMAMTLIARDPKRYGFSPPPAEPYDTEQLHVDEPTDIRRIAEAAGTSVRHLRELNPELVGSATPPNHGAYALRIPRRVRWISHTVRKGETLSAIAMRYQVSVQVLCEMNNLTETEVLKAGGVILVPAPVSPPPV